MNQFEELSELLFDACLSQMGEQAMYYPKSGSPFQISGVFTRDYQLIQEGSLDSTVSSVSSAFETAKANSYSPKAEDRLRIRGDYYRVTEIKPNGVGQIKLILKKAAGVS